MIIYIYQRAKQQTKYLKDKNQIERFEKLCHFLCMSLTCLLSHRWLNRPPGYSFVTQRRYGRMCSVQRKDTVAEKSDDDDTEDCSTLLWLTPLSPVMLV